MNTHTYKMSCYLPGELEILRQHSFTRWMSRDLLQATTDFCRNIGLHAIYVECSPDGLSRCLFWRPPQGACLEVRSGRTRQQFEEFDRKNIERNCPLLSLHISEKDIYSAVWLSTEHFSIAASVLEAYGIGPAQRIGG